MKKEFEIALKSQKDRILERFINEMKGMLFYTTDQRENHINTHKRKIEEYFIYIVSKIKFFNNILPDSTLQDLEEYLELDDTISCSGFYDYLS